MQYVTQYTHSNMLSVKPATATGGSFGLQANLFSNYLENFVTDPISIAPAQSTTNIGLYVFRSCGNKASLLVTLELT